MKTKTLLAFTIGLIAGGFIYLIVLNWKRDLPMFHRIGMSKDSVRYEKIKMTGDTLVYRFNGKTTRVAGIYYDSSLAEILDSHVVGANGKDSVILFKIIRKHKP